MTEEENYQLKKEKEIAELKEACAQKDQRIEELEGLLMQALLHIEELGRRVSKDSHNSHKPPSSDGLKHKVMNPWATLLAYWTKQVKEPFPELHSYQQETLAYCTLGIVQAGSAIMQLIAEAMAEYLDGETKVSSYERRLQRFLENERIDSDGCWKTFIEKILPSFHQKKMVLVLDNTLYTTMATIVYLGLSDRGLSCLALIRLCEHMKENESRSHLSRSEKPLSQY